MLSHSWTTRKIFVCSHASFIEVSLLLTERSRAQPNVPILQQALQYFMFIQTPILQGSGAENLKVRIKGDWEGKESKERKLK